MKKHLTILLGVLLAAATGIAIGADTTVKILHLQDNSAFLELWKQIGTEFEKQKPGVKIDWQFLENEAFKAKLPTTLQSKERPDLFYSWAGGVLYDQTRAGVLKDITKSMEGEWAETLSPAGVKAFTYEGKVYGAPMKTSLEILWYNKELFILVLNADEPPTCEQPHRSDRTDDSVYSAISQAASVETHPSRHRTGKMQARTETGASSRREA